MATLKFTPAFRCSTYKEAEEKIKKLRAEARATGWRERSSYIRELPEGEFLAVFKQEKECKEN